MSGDRVESYVNLVVEFGSIQKLQRLILFCNYGTFQFQPEVNLTETTSLHVQQKLKKISYSELNEESFAYKVRSFQNDATKCWRGNQKGENLIIPPVSPEDKTTNKGAANVVLSLLVLFGILEHISQEGATQNNIAQIRLKEGYEGWQLVVVGDGLSQIRVRTFAQLINETCFSLGKEQHATVMIHKAMKQIINVTGDLHGGCFHFLAAGCSLFYASLIQPIQNLLGWKRISGTDVTHFYQQASGIALLIVDELQKNLYTEYFLHIINDDEKRLKFDIFEDEKELSVHVDINFLQWMELKRTSTTIVRQH